MNQISFMMILWTTPIAVVLLMIKSLIIKHVEQKISHLKRDLKYVEIKLDDPEQYGRSNCIILHGSGIEQNGTNAL